MANIDAAFGAVPVGTTDGSDYHGKLREVEFVTGDSVACGIGDFVTHQGTGGTDGKTPVVARAAAGGAIIGAIVSFIPNFSDEGTLSSTPNHRAASTARKALVAWGSQVLYVMQEDGEGTPIATASIGLNVDVATVTNPNTTTGISTMEIDSSTVLQATGQLRIHHLSPDVDTVLGTTADGVNANWIVSINESQDALGAGVA